MKGQLRNDVEFLTFIGDGSTVGSPFVADSATPVIGTATGENSLKRKSMASIDADATFSISLTHASGSRISQLSGIPNCWDKSDDFKCLNACKS